MKISFDYDSTLSLETIESMVASFNSELIDIYIITSRMQFGHSNTDLYQTTERLGIIKDKIYFTESCYKWRKIKELGISIHFDDVVEESQLILQNTQCIPVLLWDKDNLELIKSDQFMRGI